MDAIILINDAQVNISVFTDYIMGQNLGFTK